MIETQRLLIRPFKPEDWRDLYEYLSDPAVVFYEPYGVFSEEASRAEAARRARDASFLAVVRKEDRKLIGNLYLAKQELDTWELGYVFSTQAQGRGYATEAAQAAVDFVIRRRGARRIVAACSTENEKSWKLLERLQMRREGHALQTVYFKTDALGRPIWLDTYAYGILASEWLARKEQSKTK